ncbi:MAG: TonB-dependent receptor plug domain-containing protein [Flavobacteriaceae bacterium]|nr:TonB-dependent receptor plug domain-containing protein [Flavobacteriaceae bacterium]
MRYYFQLLFSIISIIGYSQNGKININVYDDFSKKPINAKATIETSEQTYEGEGSIYIDEISAGIYNIEITSNGYDSFILKDIEVLPEQNMTFGVGLTKISENKIKEILISRKSYKTNIESPVSFRNITSEEVQKNAGSNRDISKTILSLPGVSSTATFRNDLFIRGGNSSENKFYIDGIEVPIINHFQTQGASGGPRGLLTIDFVKDVDFYSGAFPSKRNGALSSILEFNLREARRDKLGYKVILGLDDMQLMADGPLNKNQSWKALLSVRKSNLQLLFSKLGLPFLPSYYDFNAKISKKFTSNDELYFIALGAIDHFKFNDKPKNTPENISIIERLPILPQWNYTIGMGYRHLTQNGNWLFIWSRNMLDNQAKKYYKNIETSENLLTNYHSQEIENKVRIERNTQINNYKISYGANLNFAKYFNNSYINIITPKGRVLDRYKTDLNILQYGLYFQFSKKFFENQFEIAGGIRTDASGYSNLTNNPFKQLSPRLSLKYKIDKNFSLNFNTGIYHMLPAYTALGFKENQEFINKNTLKYIKNTHLIGGVEYNGKDNWRISLEAYYKKYKNYPFSLRNNFTLANINGDYSFIGNEILDSRGVGKTYGLELFIQKRTKNNFYGLMSYTFGHSKFGGDKSSLLYSNWDSRHILSLTGGKYFRNNWNIGLRFRLQSGLPETPYDIEKSQKVNIWNIANSPLYKYSEINTLRGNTIHQLDVRIEKKWIFKKWQFSLYLDVVNLYGSKNPSALPIVLLKRDEAGNPIISNPNDLAENHTYLLDYAKRNKATPLPYFGAIFEF